MNQRHFSIRTYFRIFPYLIHFTFFIVLLLPFSVFPQDTLQVTFDWTQIRSDTLLFGKKPSFPEPIISRIFVRDENGHHVKNLASLDRWLSQDDYTPLGLKVSDVWKHILEFHRDDPSIPDDPVVNEFEVREIRVQGVSIALAMDFSNSARDPKTHPTDPDTWDLVKDAGMALIDTMHLGKDLAAIIKVDYAPFRIHNRFTSNYDTLEAAIMTGTYPNPEIGGSAILDGILEGVRWCQEETSNRTKTVVIHTDAEETVKTGHLEQAAIKKTIIEEAMANDIHIFTIYVPSQHLTEEQKAEEPWKFLEEFADTTGGQFYKDIDKDDLDSVYVDIYKRLAGSYLLAHPSTDDAENGEWRRIQVDTLVVDGTMGRGWGYYQPPITYADVDVSKRVAASDSIHVTANGDTLHFANVGSTVRYEINVYNNGPGRARKIRITDTLPDSLMHVDVERTAVQHPEMSDIVFESISVYPDSVYPDSIVWNIARLDSGKTLRFTFQAQVSPLLPSNPDTLNNFVRVTCFNDTIPDTTLVPVPLYGYMLPDLTVQCVDPIGTASPGHPHTLYALVRNQTGVDIPNSFRIGFYHDTGLFAVATVNGLSENGFVEVSGVWSKPPMGNHNIRVMVDLSRDVREANEINNWDSCVLPVGIDTLIVVAKDVAIEDDVVVHGRRAGFPKPVLTYVDVLDQNGLFVYGLADTTDWLELSEPIQLDGSTPVDSVWTRVWEYHEANNAIPNDPNVKTPEFRVIEIDDEGELSYVLSHTSSDTLQNKTWRVVDVTVSHFGYSGSDTVHYWIEKGPDDLSIRKSAIGDSLDAFGNWYVWPTDTVKYTVVIENKSHMPVSNVPIQDVFPGVLKFESSEVSYESLEGDTIRWLINSLDVNSLYDFDYYCIVEDTLAIADTLVNEVTIQYEPDSVNTYNNTAWDTVYYVPLTPADLDVSKEVNVDSADIGDTIEYTVTLMNIGELPCSDISLQDILPEKVKDIKFQDNSASLDMSTNTLSWSVRVLEPDSTRTFTYTCVIDTMRRGFHYLTNVLLGISEDDFTPENNSDSVTVIVVAPTPDPPQIRFSKEWVEPRDSVQVQVMTPIKISRWDLIVDFADGTQNTLYANDFIQDTLLTPPGSWSLVIPDFGDEYTIMRTMETEEEVVTMTIRTWDLFGDTDEGLDTLKIRSPNEFYLGENVFHPDRGDPLDLAFKLSSWRFAEIKIYDISGAFVRQVVYKESEAGENVVTWDGRDENGRIVGSGIYIAILTSGRFQKARKFIVVR